MKTLLPFLVLCCIAFNGFAADIAPFPDFTRPESWRKNSSGTMEISRDGAENALRFELVFPPDQEDCWAYPEVNLERGVPPEMKYLVFEAKITQQNPDAGYKTALAMFAPADGKTRAKASWKPSAQWQRVVIDLDASKVDRADTRYVRIGANPKSPGMTLLLRNVGFLEQSPDALRETASLFASHPSATLFIDGQQPEFRLRERFPGLAFDALDRHGRVVASVPAPEDGRLILPVLPRGYYRLAPRDSGARFRGYRSFAVIPDPAKRRMNPDSPYAMDAALNVIGTVWNHTPGDRAQGVRFFVEMARLAGVGFARDRIHQDGSETAPGVYTWDRFEPAPRIFAEAGIRLSASWHSSAPWALAEKGGKLPRDLTTAYSFGKKLAETFKGQVQVWEFWNEPDRDTFLSEGAWEFAAMSKAAYLGFKAGAPDIPVTNGSFSRPPTDPFDNILLRNGMAGYFDIFNFHTYAELKSYPKLIAGWKRLLHENGVPDMPVWITECGTNAEGVAALPTRWGDNRAQSPEQEMLWAEFVPKSQLLWQSLGIARTFTFVLPPMNEQGGAKDWGMLRRDYTAKPAFVSFATLTDQLAAAEYIGQPDLGKGIRCFLFRRPDGDHTLAFWSESELDLDGNALSGKPFPREITVPAQASGILTDLFGTPETVAPEEGRFRLTATRYPAYLTGRFTLPIETPPPAKADIAGVGLWELDKSVVLRVIPTSGFEAMKTQLMLSVGAKEHKLKLQIANFDDTAKRGRVTVEGEVSGLPAEVELKPFEVREFDLTVSSLPSKLHRYRFGGVFNDRPISHLELPIISISAADGKPLTGSDDAANWRKNSSGDMIISRDETEKAVRFDVSFGPNVDRWVYPEFLPREPLTGLLGIAFEIKAEPSPKAAHTLVMLVGEAEDGGGAREERFPYRLSANGDWQENVLWFPRSAEATVETLRIGMNPRTDQASFWIRNIRIYRP